MLCSCKISLASVHPGLSHGFSQNLSFCKEKRKIKNKLHGRKNCLSKLNLSANCSNIGFLNHREITSVAALVLHPSATSQHLLMETTKIPAYSPAGPRAVQGKPNKKKLELETEWALEWFIEEKDPERRVLKEKMSNRNSLLTSSSREARRRARDAEMRTLLLFSSRDYQEVDREKKGAALVQQLKMRVSHWTNTY